MPYAGGEFPTSLSEVIARHPMCVHGAYGILRHFWNLHNLPEPSVWLDTALMARAAGLPEEFDALCGRLRENVSRTAPAERLTQQAQRARFANVDGRSNIQLIRTGVSAVFALSNSAGENR
jgi:hypothetical protein